MDAHVDRCLFRQNVASKGGGAVFFAGALNAKLLIERSIFEANAVRPPQSGERNAPATIVTYTSAMGVESFNRPVSSQAIRPLLALVGSS